MSESTRITTDPDGVNVTEGTYPLDIEMSNRDRKGRNLFFLGFVASLNLLMIVTCSKLTNLIFDFDGTGLIGALLGFAIANAIIISMFDKYFIIRNDQVTAFVTIDQLQTFLGRPKAYVVYGPGSHLSYPWEERFATFSVSLEEGAGDVTFVIQCIDGVVRGKGSYRQRPDKKRLIPYFLGVANLPGEIEDFIAQNAVLFFIGRTVEETISDLKGLNRHMDETLVEGVDGSKTSEIERRFGIELTDVTIKELLPSEEVQRSISAIAETKAIAVATLELLGYSSWRKVQNAIAKGVLKQADVSEVRNRVLSISGNLDGMDIRRNEIDFRVEGLDPEIVKLIADVAKSPAGAALIAGKSGSKKGGSK